LLGDFSDGQDGDRFTPADASDRRLKVVVTILLSAHHPERASLEKVALNSPAMKGLSAELEIPVTFS
jgi:hypothetical protein